MGEEEKPNSAGVSRSFESTNATIKDPLFLLLPPLLPPLLLQCRTPPPPPSSLNHPCLLYILSSFTSYFDLSVLSSSFWLSYPTICRPRIIPDPRTSTSNFDPTKFFFLPQSRFTRSRGVRVYRNCDNFLGSLSRSLSDPITRTKTYR